MPTTKTKKLTFTIPGYDLMDACPFTPEGATAWEAQEIRRVWHNCINYAKDVMSRIQSAFDRLPDDRQSCNDAQHLGCFIAARAELAARIDGVKHRLASTKDPAHAN